MQQNKSMKFDVKDNLIKPQCILTEEFVFIVNWPKSCILTGCVLNNFNIWMHTEIEEMLL